MDKPVTILLPCLIFITIVILILAIKNIKIILILSITNIIIVVILNNISKWGVLVPPLGTLATPLLIPQHTTHTRQQTTHCSLHIMHNILNTEYCTLHIALGTIQILHTQQIAHSLGIRPKPTHGTLH